MTSVHSRDDVRIFHKQVRTLLAAGYDVGLIAPDRGNKLAGDVRYLPVPVPSNRWERFTRTQGNILTRALRENANLYHIHDPELICLGIVLRLLGRNVIYDAHEDVRLSILSKSWIPKWLRKPASALAGAMESVAFKGFTGIVSATPAIARRFDGRKSVVVQNFPLFGELLSGDFDAYDSRPSTIAYVGGISRIRGACEMVRAISIVKESFDARLVMAGGVSGKGLRDELVSLAPPNRLRLLGPVSRSEVGRLLGESRIGLVLFKPAPNHREAQPNKLFEYMSAGIPVIASDFPLWRRIVEEYRCGLLVDPLDPAGIAEAIEYLLANPTEAAGMGRNGEAAVQEVFNWEAEARKLVDFYQGIFA